MKSYYRKTNQKHQIACISELRVFGGHRSDGWLLVDEDGTIAARGVVFVMLLLKYMFCGWVASATLTHSEYGAQGDLPGARTVISAWNGGYMIIKGQYLYINRSPQRSADA